MKLGIRREKIGDIVVRDDGADILCIKEISEILKTSLKELKRFSKATIETIDMEIFIEHGVPDVPKEEFNIIVSSFRIDSIVSELINISRTKALEVIREERVFINFENCINNSKLIKIGDIVTIRGKGRFYIVEQVGSTKKDNIILKVSMNK